MLTSGSRDAAGNTVLVVDDDAATLKFLVALLRPKGFDLEMAANGQEAIDKLRHQTFAAVVLDLMMPGASGYDVIAFLESEKRGDPVIVCTAAGTRSTAEIRSTNVRGVIHKPFDIDELSSLLAKVMSENT